VHGTGTRKAKKGPKTEGVNVTSKPKKRRKRRTARRRKTALLNVPQMPLLVVRQTYQPNHPTGTISFFILILACGGSKTISLLDAIWRHLVNGAFLSFVHFCSSTLFRPNNNAGFHYYRGTRVVEKTGGGETRPDSPALYIYWFRYWRGASFDTFSTEGGSFILHGRSQHPPILNV